MPSFAIGLFELLYKSTAVLLAFACYTLHVFWIYNYPLHITILSLQCGYHDFNMALT